MLGLNLSESRVLREEAEKGEARGQQQGDRSLVLRQLSRRVGPFNRLITAIHALSLEQLESLSKALLDFTGLQEFGSVVAGG